MKTPIVRWREERGLSRLALSVGSGIPYTELRRIEDAEIDVRLSSALILLRFTQGYDSLDIKIDGVSPLDLDLRKLAIQDLVGKPGAMRIAKVLRRQEKLLAALRAPEGTANGKGR